MNNLFSKNACNKDFYNTLKEQHVDEDYRHAKKILEWISIKATWDHFDLYLKTDTLLFLSNLAIWAIGIQCSKWRMFN